MSKRVTAQRALELILEDSETHSEVEEEDVSEYEDNVEINSEYESEFEDELSSEHTPEGAPQQIYMSKKGQIEWPPPQPNTPRTLLCYHNKYDTRAHTNGSDSCS